MIVTDLDKLRRDIASWSMEGLYINLLALKDKVEWEEEKRSKKWTINLEYLELNKSAIGVIESEMADRVLLGKDG